MAVEVEAMTNIEKLRLLNRMHCSLIRDRQGEDCGNQNAYHYDQACREEESARRELSDALIALASELIAVAEAAERFTAHAAGEDPIKNEDRLTDALTKLNEVEI
jgi:hypothetical protein